MTHNKILQRLAEKGNGTFSSRHEILGVLQEEFTELEDAVRDGELTSEVRHEIMDIAVGAVFAIACIDAHALDW